MHTISNADLDRATTWVRCNVDGTIQAVILESLEQSKRILYNTQLNLEDEDCALVFRSWGNEIFMSHTEDFDDLQLKLAVAVRSVAAKKDEPELWDYLTNFESNSSFESLMERLQALPTEANTPPRPAFEVIVGGKK